MVIFLRDELQEHPRTSRKTRPIPGESKLEEHPRQLPCNPVKTTTLLVNKPKIHNLNNIHVYELVTATRNRDAR